MSTNTTRIGAGGFNNGSDMAVVAIIAGAAFVSLGTWLSGQLAGVLFKFTWPDASFGEAFTIAFALPNHLADPRQAWPAAARDQLPGPIGFYTAMLLVLAAMTVLGVFAGRRAASARQARGMASKKQLGKTMTASAVLGKAGRLRPGLECKAVKLTDVAVELGRAIGSGAARLYATLETSVLLLAPPRQGKTSQVIIPWLRSFPGPALVTSVRHDVFTATATLRPGTPLVMDLTGDLKSWPHRVSWSPVVGCADFDIARRRADVMVQVGKNGPGDASNSSFFGLTATNLLACWLHTAALTGRSMGEVVTWSLADSNDEPVKLLRDATGAEPGVLELLDSFYRQPGPTRSNLWTTVQTATASLLGKVARQVFCGPTEASMDLGAFLASGQGTIYLLVDENQVEALAPLVTAFVREMLLTATRMAVQNPAGRLDPPLGLILDEVTQVVPLPDLPKIMASAAGFGIFIAAVAQNLAAIDERWGEVGRRILWGNSGIKIALGGLAGEDLEEFSQLAGNYRETLLVPQRNRDGISTQATVIDRKTMSPEAIRTLDEADREGLVIHATTPAVKVRMTRHYEGPHAADHTRAEGEARAVLYPTEQVGTP
ncbi:TraM recognition domain-containing protein [Longispora sp. NPDC051575]|uniref:type IV secretory system conjugative DNA transfer family protein n=1 Tax=Longispora sp. NPDC051575 TaxID=3154943 RepID=UPI0034212144